MTTPSLPHLAAIGMLALALPLAACGRKGSLDPPPGGYALEQGTAKTPVSGAEFLRGVARLPARLGRPNTA